MTDFNLKQWLFENKMGAYEKASRLKELDVDSAFEDGDENRGDLQEVDPAALGVGQAEADAEMEKRDDLNSDMVDNASMGVVAEASNQSTEVEIKGWEVNILGKDHIIDADVTVDFHYEEDDYVDHMVVSPGGYFVDGATAVITGLGVEEGDTYRDVNDPVYAKQIQDLINTDPRLNRMLEDEASNAIEWDSMGEEDRYEGPDMEETVGYVMKTKPSDPLERGDM